MLFSYNIIWKYITISIFAWFIFLLGGFEFAVVTLLALNLIKNN